MDHQIAPSESDPTAQLGRRVGAVLIDWAFWVVLGTLGVGAANLIGSTAAVPLMLAPWAAWIWVHVWMQGTQGWTLGKKILDLRVVDRDTFEPPGKLRALIREVCWLVDALPAFGLLALAVAVTSPGHRRLGDMAAKTLVVRSDCLGAPVPVPGLTSAVPAPAVHAMSAHPSVDVQAPSQTATAPSGDAPQWDAARNAWIQWDSSRSEWLQWDSAASQWGPISQ